MHHKFAIHISLLLTLIGCRQIDDPESGVDTTIEENEVEENSSSKGEIFSAAGLDLSSEIALIDQRTCDFSVGTERAFDALLTYDWESDRALTASSITVGERSLKTEQSESPYPDYPGSRIITASARFPEGSMWNSLNLSRIRREEGIFPDTDSYHARSLTFLNSPSEVQVALQDIGLEVPIAPGYNELIDDACGGSMQIEKIDGGAALSCAFGC